MTKSPKKLAWTYTWPVMKSINIWTMEIPNTNDTITGTTTFSPSLSAGTRISSPHRTVCEYLAVGPGPQAHLFERLPKRSVTVLAFRHLLARHDGWLPARSYAGGCQPWIGPFRWPVSFTDDSEPSLA